VLDTFNTGTGTQTVFGLAVFGEITVADPEYQLRLFEGASETDGTYGLGQEAKAKADTNDPLVTQVVFRWIAPSAAETEDTQLLVGGTAESTFNPNEVGDWTVEADFGNGQVVRQTLHIDFLVIPESPFGIAALVGSSLAALGAFMFLRNRNSTRSAGLGI
jgi:hypothetical protein